MAAEEGRPDRSDGLSAEAPTAPARQLAAEDGRDAAASEAEAHHAEALAEMEDRWRQALADLDNVRKRYERELARATAAERQRVAVEWLPVLDNLELALEHAGADPAAIVEGVRAVRDMAVGVLARLGFPRHDEVGVPFDPARHEALSTASEPGATPGTVVKVLRPGYGDGERLLRPAAVVVAATGRST
jgi:molecular chaperone GrpE